MVLSGTILYAVLAFLAAWLFCLLYGTYRFATSMRRPDDRRVLFWVNLSAFILASVAVASLLLLHASWITPEVSQRLGIRFVGFLANLSVFPSAIGLFLSFFGKGKMRGLAAISCLGSGVWWLVLAIDSGIAMGAPLARHPIRYLIPDRYVGWVEVRYGVSGSPRLPIQNSVLVCRIPASGSLATSSTLEDGWAEDEYDYYDANGALRRLRETGWSGGGQIWGVEMSRSVGSEADPERDEYIYVGSEEQFKKGETKSGLRPPG
jgi:hypothetical protein